ncbi:unnamed protein product [Mytilus coruscus]|uniref:Uncharacterized protein n=1 Tax=Mytilus coruscus TaxID=42192 RepID=A0A6J8CX00_MYTCO|nr:unnamed protein product [Mytilus coruscus]
MIQNNNDPYFYSSNSKIFRRNISLDSVQRKDRQATAAIAEISSEKVLDCLHNSDNDVVVCTVVPEKYRKCDDNHPSILKEPVYICLSDDPSVLYVADRENRGGRSSKRHKRHTVLDIGIDAVVPTKLVKIDKDLFFVADQKTKSILQVSVKRKVAAYGYDLFGTSLYSISVPDMSGCFGLAYCSNYLYLADHTAGILRLELDSNTVSVILKTGTEICNQPHGIAIIYSDVDRRWEKSIIQDQRH